MVVNCGFEFMAEKVELQRTEQRCAYYLPAKKRCCKMLVVQGSEYCGQHLDTLVSKYLKCVPYLIRPSMFYA